MSISYAGIGSRNCPDHVSSFIIAVSQYLASRGFILRSGGADGCDNAFEQGCDLASGAKEIFIPWAGFNGRQYLDFNIAKASLIAKQYHPRYTELSFGAQKLMNRNSCQVLGANLDNPVKFIICYTPNGSGSGGTGQALRIAKANNIPIFDIGKYAYISSASTALKQFLRELNL